MGIPPPPPDLGGRIKTIMFHREKEILFVYNVMTLLSQSRSRQKYTFQFLTVFLWKIEHPHSYD
jgi:hypothetical protein